MFILDTTAGVPLISTTMEPGRIEIVEIPITSMPLDKSDDFTASANAEIVVWLIDAPNTELNAASNTRRVESLLADDE